MPREDETRLVGAILRNASDSFALRCRCSPKLPEAEKTANDETRVKQHFAETETGLSVCTERTASWTLSSVSKTLLTEQQRLRRSSPHTEMCSIGRGAHAHTHTHTCTSSRTRSKVLHRPRALASSNAEGKRLNQFEQRGKR
ncbi:uncharacterized protein V6R79_016870 [Siganus canaliculatus]